MNFIINQIAGGMLVMNITLNTDIKEKGRPTDHRNMDLTKLHRDVIRGSSNGMIIWQPRICCWYDDRIFKNEELPHPYTGMSLPEIYRELGCSNRNYTFNNCFKKVYDSRVKRYSRKISELETEYVMETPVGRINTIIAANTSNGGEFPKKWWVTCEEDLKVMSWIEERCTWEWNEERYRENLNIWGDLGLPTVYMPRVNVQHLFIDIMGVEGAIYALIDYEEGVIGKYFQVLSESHERLIEVINKSPIEVINFGDNVHGGVLSPDLFKKYVLPEYQKRNELLHRANKFTHCHWDGDTKSLLPFVKECGFDGIEAVTPKPQGDVTIDEIKEAFGDELFLLDGIAAILFEDIFPIEELEKQTRELIEKFGPKLILGISDEMSSMGNLDRIKFVGEIVDEYNAKCKM